METIKTIPWYDLFYKSRESTFAVDIKRELDKRLGICKYPIKFDLYENPRLRVLISEHIAVGFDVSRWVNRRV